MNISRIASPGSSRIESFTPPAVQPASVTKKAAPAEAPVSGGPVLNTAEKDYFAGAFPAASVAVRAHNVYTPDGKTATPASTGGLIDRKG